MAAPRRTTAASDVLVAARVTPAERDAIRDAARRDGVTVSDYLRARALAENPRKRGA